MLWSRFGSHPPSGPALICVSLAEIVGSHRRRTLQRLGIAHTVSDFLTRSLAGSSSRAVKFVRGGRLGLYGMSCSSGECVASIFVADHLTVAIVPNNSSGSAALFGQLLSLNSVALVAFEGSAFFGFEKRCERLIWLVAS